MPLGCLNSHIVKIVVVSENRETSALFVINAIQMKTLNLKWCTVLIVAIGFMQNVKE